ncbi:MAG: hypothetical protein E6G56_14305 [Actinobacteria bacterium]|nr:MAG: hypothetical protein E6G56_14305 [Actinomycetota bacterium]
MTGPSLPDKIAAIHDRLSRARIAHAFGGALALAYYAEPRATIDIDLNVFVSPSRYPSVRDALAPLGVGDEVDEAQLVREGQCRLWWDRTPLDLFFAYHELHEAMRRGARSVPFGETRIPILAPEHLVVCKAAYDRPKDWLDIEQVLICAEPIEADEMRAWLARLAGRHDPRTQRLDRVVAQLLGR